MNDAVIGPGLIASMREGLRNGVQGCAWDNVAWVGAWDIELDQLQCPGLLWYGEEDLFAPPDEGEWLNENRIARFHRTVASWAISSEETEQDEANRFLEPGSRQGWHQVHSLTR